MIILYPIPRILPQDQSPVKSDKTGPGLVYKLLN